MHHVHRVLLVLFVAAAVGTAVAEGDVVDIDALVEKEVSEVVCERDASTPGTLDALLDDDTLQYFFFGGKGGVGKTTVSSSFAIRLARERKARGMAPVLLLSTDPAHSLSDAMLEEFGGRTQPSQYAEGLHVVEIDPAVMLAREARSWTKLATDVGFDVAEQVSSFQQWLTSLPGVDEATALSSVVDTMKSGKYSAVVFDTAPTGHTLKLLQLPSVLGAGLAQLQSWQSSLWKYYKMFAGFLSGKKDNTDKVKAQLERKMLKYKRGIESVAAMLKDHTKTTFVTVAIAEHLSIAETERLMSELNEAQIRSTHVVVNQLLNPPSINEATMDAALSAASLGDSEAIRNAVRLVEARAAIQRKYLADLQTGAAQSLCKTVVELPLLPHEVTGTKQLLAFSDLYRTSRPQLGAAAPKEPKEPKVSKEDL